MNIEQINQRTSQLAVGERLILPNIPDSIYHQTEGIGSSLMKAAALSPAVYKQKLDAGYDATDTEATRIGKLVHCLVLQPDRYSEDYAKQPSSIKRRAGAEWEKFLQENSDKTIVRDDELDTASALAEAVIDQAGKFFIGGEAELSYWYKDASGFILKARIDYQLGDAAIDLKTDRAETDAQFQKTVKYEYHIQDALYRRVTNLADMIFIGISKETKQCFGYVLDTEPRRYADSLLAATIDRLAEAREFNDYSHQPLEIKRIN